MSDTSIPWVINADGSLGKTWNPTTGCNLVSPGCAHCLDPDTSVLMASMQWMPIGSLSVGDAVVGFTDTPGPGQNRVYERATVVHAWSVTSEAVEITAGARTIVASVDHKFLAPTRPYWREAEHLSLQSKIVDLEAPQWIPDIKSEPYLAGYLAGAIGGDGTFRIDGSGKSGTKQSYLRIADPTFDMPLLERVAEAMSVLGCTNISILPFDPGPGGYLPAAGEREPMSKVETRRMANLVIVRDRCIPERDDLGWKAGFLAGFFDTDGCYSGGNLRYGQVKNNELLDATSRYIKDLGFRSSREDFRSSLGLSERVVGSLEDKIRFLSTIQPALERKATDFYGRRFPGGRSSMVDGVRRLGVRSLIDIQTTSGTFIAAGFATHNCYAMRQARRFDGMGRGYDGTTKMTPAGAQWSGVVNLNPDRLSIPLKRKKPTTWFVNSMSDLFHESIPDEFIAAVFGVMAACPQHRFQILTKRIERALRWYEWMSERPWQRIVAASRHDRIPDADDWRGWPLPNVWLGVSAENQETADERIPTLLQCPAAVRFLSLEPLLGPIDLERPAWVGADPSRSLVNEDGVRGASWLDDFVDWVIVGGESGNDARTMELEWAESILDQCRYAGVAAFMKQVGSVQAKRLALKNKKGEDITELPERLRVREMPRVA